MDLAQNNTGEPSEPFRLLRTKLFVPRVHPDQVARPDLVARLNEGLGRKSTLVTAPAGFGKSALLSSWALSLALPVSWVSRLFLMSWMPATAPRRSNEAARWAC